MIVGARGTVCTGAAVAADLVLTAGHCTVSGNAYKIADGVGMFAPTLATVTGISRHPNFNLQTMLAHRATADVALMKLARPLPQEIVQNAILIHRSRTCFRMLPPHEAHCRSRLAGYQVPRSWEVVTELPRTETGKLARRTVRDRHWSGRARRI